MAISRLSASPLPRAQKRNLAANEKQTPATE